MLIAPDRWGCAQHNIASLWRTGQVADTETVKLAARYSTMENNKRGYQATSASALTPWYLLDIRNSLCSNNSVHEFQTFTMMLLSCRMAFRADELINISINSFATVSHLHRVDSNGNVQSLAVRVMV